jgi:hypothetical protein
MIAANGGFDQAQAITIAAAGQWQLTVTRVRPPVGRRRWCRIVPRLLRDRLTHERPEFVFVHQHLNIDIDAIDDADDSGVDWRPLLSQRFSSRASLEHNQHFFVYACTDAVDREQRAAARRPLNREWLHEHQLRSFELAMLLRRHDGSDHSCYLHQSKIVNLQRHLQS